MTTPETIAIWAITIPTVIVISGACLRGVWLLAQMLAALNAVTAEVTKVECKIINLSDRAEETHGIVAQHAHDCNVDRAMIADRVTKHGVQIDAHGKRIESLEGDA